MGLMTWLLGTAAIVSLLFLAPLTASHLFPTRSPPGDAGAIEHPAVTAAAPTEAAAAKPGTPRAPVQRAASAKPPAEPPPWVPPRSEPAAPRLASATIAPSGTLAVGLTRILAPTTAELPSVPTAELSQPVLTPSEPAAPANGPAPSIGTIPTPREALPLQTEMLAPEPPPSDTAPRRKPPPPSGNDRSTAATTAQRRG